MSLLVYEYTSVRSQVTSAYRLCSTLLRVHRAVSDVLITSGPDIYNHCTWIDPYTRSVHRTTWHACVMWVTKSSSDFPINLLCTKWYPSRCHIALLFRLMFLNLDSSRRGTNQKHIYIYCSQNNARLKYCHTA
jgi:hypothetical protein